MAQKTTISVRVSAELLKAIDARAAKEFCSRSEAAALLIAASGDVAAVEPSPMAATKEESAAVDLAVKKLRLQQLKKELIPVEDAVRVVENCFGGQRVEGESLMNDIADEFGLDSESLRRRFNERMAGTFAVEREPFEKIAAEFSEAPLP